MGETALVEHGSAPIGRGPYLLVANAYPDDEHLYRNAFIHRRVLAYRAGGLEVDVLYLRGADVELVTYEFDGVTVWKGGIAQYAEILASKPYRKVLVHFPQEHLIKTALQNHPDTPLIAWVHGFETEQWFRRWFNMVEDPAEISRVLALRGSWTSKQLGFLRSLFTDTEHDVTIVQVSEWFQKHVSEPDVGAAPVKSVVIPNVIDSTLFPYRVKTPQQRTRILSIRPFESRKYANDLTVEAIQILSQRPYFDELTFELYGDGRLWERLTAPLQGFENVTLHNRFVGQDEIPEIHAGNGVFLAPTRFDSQGVSMCEAMSSGLVAISTDIAAIPDFIDHERTGLLGQPESALDIADLIEALYLDPELFQRLSAAGAADIQARCGTAATIGREMELIES